MTTLQEHQFEIVPGVDDTNGVVFGLGADVHVDGDGFDPGSAEWLTQTTQNTRRGVNAFGRDVKGASTWTWASHTDQADVASALTALEKLAGAWNPEALSREPGAMAAVRYRIANRTRRVFGRPRRFAAPPSNLILSGYVAVTHDFECVDSYTYDDVYTTVSLPFSSGAVGGGLTFPLILPTTSAPASESGIYNLQVGGNARAYPVIRLNGPWTNPVVTADDWTIKWTGSIPSGGWVEIDARPWALTVLNHNGASVVGGLDRRTWLEDVWFAPGSSPSLVLSGVAASGGAHADVKWRNTWTSL